ncbi:MAG: hypothetical protein ACLPPV_00345 [Candidatus Korobacteraceae bacterium]|jgi:hypothetical protein
MLRNLLGRFVYGMLCVMALGAFLASCAYGQTFHVLHAFTDLDDGGLPEAGLTIDAAGSLYGTTLGTIAYDGTVFRMNNVNGGWVLNTLFTFGEQRRPAFRQGRLRASWKSVRYD